MFVLLILINAIETLDFPLDTEETEQIHLRTDCKSQLFFLSH